MTAWDKNEQALALEDKLIFAYIAIIALGVMMWTIALFSSERLVIVALGGIGLVAIVTGAIKLYRLVRD